MSFTLVDSSPDSPLATHDDNFYAGCEIAIIGGTGEGQVRLIVSSDRETKSVTVSEAWDTDPDNTSAYKIYQYGIFPRFKDVFWDPEASQYHKSIPERVKAAVAAQAEYMDANPDLFTSDSVYMASENFSKYGYTLKNGVSWVDRLISPKAKELLRGIRNVGGKIRLHTGGQMRT